MAVSKNNRRKGKKRIKGHRAPPKPVPVEEEEVVSEEKTNWYGFLSMGIMLVGFLGAMLTSYGLVFYPITFVGAAMSLFKTKWDTTSHKISIVCCIVYCIAVAVMWVAMLTNNTTITSIVR